MFKFAGQTSQNGPMAQWITRLTTDQKIAGSNPAGIVNIFFSFISRKCILEKMKKHLRPRVGSNHQPFG